MTLDEFQDAAERMERSGACFCLLVGIPGQTVTRVWQNLGAGFTFEDVAENFREALEAILAQTRQPDEDGGFNPS